MRILSPLKVVFVFLIVLVSRFESAAQNQTLTVSQDSKFEELLNEKRKISPNLLYNDRFKIQIYNGVSENAKKTLTEFKQEYKNIDGTIIFQTPNYKVWIGNFRTRMEAERNFNEIKDKYKNILLIRPSK